MTKKTFTFIVFTFNHEKYITEYLESVKYQIEKYGYNIQIKLVISDDSSSDNTVSMIDIWCDKNKYLFFEIVFIRNKQNLGTCNNFVNTWNEVTSDLFHFCAGDDLYSFENIFELSSLTKNYDVVSYMPLYLKDGIISLNYKAILGLVSSNIIYRSFKNRVKNINYLFAPCLFYNIKIIKNSKISNFIKSFKVVEDLPFQIMIGEEFKALKFKQKYKVLLYYRRTTNSTYIIKNDNFSRDKVKILEHMIDLEPFLIKKALIKNRIFCFKSKSFLLKNIFNLNYYIYFLKTLLSLFPILNEFISVKIEINSHKMYYDYIRLKASEFSLNNNK